MRFDYAVARPSRKTESPFFLQNQTSSKTSFKSPSACNSHHNQRKGSLSFSLNENRSASDMEKSWPPSTMILSTLNNSLNHLVICLRFFFFPFKETQENIQHYNSPWLLPPECWFSRSEKVRIRQALTNELCSNC